MADRRQDPDPHPPPNIEERRHCSDEFCSASRKKWFDESVLPSLKIMFFQGVAAMVIGGATSLFFIVSALIDRHTLEIEREFSLQYVSKPEHDEDIKHLTREFDRLSTEVGSATQRIIANQSVIMNKLEGR